MSKSVGGLSSIKYSLKVANKVGYANFWKSIQSKNTCKTCAYGMGGQSGGMRNEAGTYLEICKKSIQAQLSDIQKGIGKEFYSENSIEDIRKLRPRELESLGRLNHPLHKAVGDSHYSVISWDEVTKRISDKFNAVDSDKVFFYASGRSSNEAAFVLQLFARLYGTNNVNNCSYYCHQASGVGLNSTIGSGTATLELDDLKKADLFFVFGANPASNHPRFLTELMHCRRRGGHVVIVNPMKEPGLVRFAIPSDIRSMIGGGSEIASHYIQPHIGGDIAFVQGIAKYVIETGAVANGFISDCTNGYKSYEEKIANVSWKDIESSSGVSREAIEEIAKLYCSANNVVFSWSMGITHHLHGVENVESIANLAMLRGMLGKRYSGLLPLRGHSNVQGIGSIGVTPALKEKVFENIESHLNIKLPESKGMDTMSCMEAAKSGDINMAFILGGNLLAANPDRVFAEEAMNAIPFRVFLNTTFNESHFNGVDQEVIVLPCIARDEEQQSTTQESMFSYVRMSDGGTTRLDNVRSEVDIICSIAEGVIDEQIVDFKKFKNHSNIRTAIAATIPGFSGLSDMDETKKEFQIDGRVLHEPVFATPDKKAKFKLIDLPVAGLNGAGNTFNLMSARSEGQFNTIVYEEKDLFRGQTERWIVLMNSKDIDGMQINEDDLVDIQSKTGEMHKVKVKPFDIRR
ncbi:MAG: histidine kinase, partial [Bacteroidetes bacterium]